MSIGLYDADFMTYTPICFNLDLMKLSTYYKKQYQVVVLAPKIEPERYSHFIFRKDYNDGIFDKAIFNDNVDYGGHAFSGTKYASLPEEIQQVKPDKNLYDKFFNKYTETKKLQGIFKTMVNAEHIRLSLDGKTIWKDFIKTFTITNHTRCVIFHDYNLSNIENSYEIIKNIAGALPSHYGRKGQLVGMKFPIQIYNEKDFEKWTKFNPMNIMYGLQYNGIMSNESFQNFLLQSNSKSISHNLFYNVTYGLSDENEFIEKELPKIFRQVLLSRTLKIKIILKYDDNFFIDKKWERLIRLFNMYNGSAQKNTYSKTIYPGALDWSKTFSLYRYITSKNFLKYNTESRFTIEELREIFQLVREKNYETFKMFYESCLVELKGGEIIDV